MILLETFGVLFFLGCSILALALCLIHENKSYKRLCEWRDNLLLAIQEISREKEVIVLTAYDLEMIKGLEKKENEN